MPDPLRPVFLDRRSSQRKFFRKNSTHLLQKHVLLSPCTKINKLEIIITKPNFHVTLPFNGKTISEICLLSGSETFLRVSIYTSDVNVSFLYSFFLSGLKIKRFKINQYTDWINNEDFPMGWMYKNNLKIGTAKFIPNTIRVERDSFTHFMVCKTQMPTKICYVISPCMYNEVIIPDNLKKEKLTLEI